MTTKYARIAKQLESDISDGIYVDKLPNERELCAKFGVSRNTINQALHQLEDLGLIFRKHGSGTYIRKVLDIDTNSQAAHIHNFADGFTYSAELNNFKAETEVINFEMVLANEDLSERLNVKKLTPLFKVERLRKADSITVCYETNILPVSLLPNLNPDIMAGSLFRYAEKQLNQKIVNASVRVTAPLADQIIQEQLKLPKENPVVIRSESTVFIEDGTPLEFSDTYYLPAYFSLKSNA